MANAPNTLQEILIARITPQFLERGPLWFSEHLHAIKSSLGASAFWKESVVILSTGLAIRPSLLLRTLTDFGYEKTGKIIGKGEYMWQGNILEVWPINMAFPVRVEFFGNMLEEISRAERQAISTGPRISFRASLEKLPANSFIVHIDHGIGIFRGKTHEDGHEYFLLEYAPPRDDAEPDRLLVPVEQAKKLSPYIGFTTPAIHRLGGAVWFSTRRKVKETTAALAEELIALYKKRLAATRPPYTIPPHIAREFDEGFLYEETPDQKKATADIDRDLASPRPMDRIICGDVGFGKTEIAMRAAFRAAINGKQTALIAPTTILAEQHLRNFTERFSATAVFIAGISRLTPKTEIRRIRSDIENGKIDILIGTHRLLSRDIAFKNLGLVVIDEEQKFGVRQKERFKKLRSDIDILSLSATPIPRTLSLSLARLRDISLIATPPAGRIPIRTYVLPYSKKIVREAITAELERKGQVYFLHNRIETMELFQKKLRALTPGAAIRSIHGRMKENDMIAAMEDFREKKFDVLLATTIIENGLDFSNVNTLIVEDATKLGLAQAHQIRGRIGRGDRSAHAFFLYPVRKFANVEKTEPGNFQNKKGADDNSGRKFSNGVNRASRLTDQSLERLTALQEFSELGAGYEIALRDLEIRGAGNILGREQSGAINKVGFNLYCQMLSEAVESLRHNAASPYGAPA